ncbi:MAG: DUF2911 domain-containing protein, partial [Flavobacteriaceae bacterium]
MKATFIKIILCACVFVGQAQVKTPMPSPKATNQQVVGLTNVTVEYSRPGVKGRKIFGELVPFGKLWRTGANQNTTISFDQAITVGKTVIPAGSYALFSKPSKKNWEIIFYSDTANWGTPRQWDADKIVASTSVPVTSLANSVETFAIDFRALHNNGATLVFSWENTQVALPFTVNTKELVIQSIDANMQKNPKAKDYYNAANYYYENDINLKKAEKWIKKANELTEKKPRYWFLRKQALIYAKNGKKKEAIKIAK